MLDEGSFRSWDTAPLEVATNDAYRRERAAASCLDESVGEGTVFGRRVALVACEFDFLARSIGVAERLPLLALRSSGGTRMQEGTVAFLQMVKIAAPSSCTNGRTCPTWSTCAIPPPGCSPPGFAGVTSPPRAAFDAE